MSTIFFFSSRRRHTRLQGDWSSDVCSSDLYFRRVLPAIGRAVSKHRDAYTYLPESVLDFPDPDAFARRLASAGFTNVGHEVLTGGIFGVHHGTGPAGPDLVTHLKLEEHTSELPSPCNFVCPLFALT